MEKLPLISVIIPVYNAQGFLATCLDSLRAQTYGNMEFIVVNDGSADGSPQICDRFAGVDARFRVLHQSNLGVSAARNAGLCLVKGEYIGFVDADDRVRPDMYKKLYALVRRENAKIAACNFSLVKDGIGTVNPLPDSWPYEGTLCGDDAYSAIFPAVGLEGYLCNKLFHQSFFCGSDALALDVGLSMCEDRVLMARILARHSPVAYTREPLYYYLLHSGSALHRGDSKPDVALRAREVLVELLPPLHASYDRSCVYWLLVKSACAAYAQGRMDAFAASLNKFRAVRAGYRPDYVRYKKELSRKTRAAVALFNWYPRLTAILWKASYGHVYRDKC